MTINRRAVVAGTALAVVAPAFGLLPAQAAASVPSPVVPTVGRIIFMIEGWSAEDVSAKDDPVWLRVSPSWRTAWR